MPTPYENKYKVGELVHVRSREELELFARGWRYHHKLTAEQIACAGVEARVLHAAFYHGGDPLYDLDGLPGMWHEVCLTP